MKMLLNPLWPSALRSLEREVVRCEKCVRLKNWREEVVRTKRRAYTDCEYWGRPVPSFGDPKAELLVVGLAPGAHGANRTGRMFTGDRSGDFLYRALYETGFASQPTSTSQDDGLTLRGAFITAPVRCVPPDNKPAREEAEACRAYFHRTLKLLDNVKVVVALGAFAFSEYLSYLKDTERIGSRAPFPFGHGVLHATHEGGPLLMGCYHPSQQNTSTGKLTAEMLREVFERARQIVEARSKVRRH
jgi:uracil-DNA glycosylase family 4